MPVTAFITGAGLSISSIIATSMLLYFAPRLLRTTGFLVGLVLLAAAMGIWAASSETASTRRRWLLILIAYIAAAVYSTLWTTQPALRQTTLGGALATLFLLAQPAYASGALLTVITHESETLVWALLGAALGAAVGAGLLIPTYDADVIFFGIATALLIARLWYEAAAVSPRDYHSRVPMIGKTVLVTGVGNPGQVGYALAEAFVKAGARVVAVDVSDRVEELARQLGSDTIGLRADLTNPVDVETLLHAVHERCGALHAVVNAAGGLSVIKPLAETSREEWQREIQRNGDTAFLINTIALPLLRESRGCIVNFASPAGIRAQPRLGAYSAAKAAVVALTRALAIEEKQQVRVNAIAPGMIDTEQNRRAVENPEQVRWVSREQVASVVLFLCSDAAAAITGETIHVLGDGIE
ncbi:MAG: SDR family NAD(P)-dependent oxidoreductase [Gemmatimonadota bacterium]